MMKDQESEENGNTNADTLLNDWKELLEKVRRTFGGNPHCEKNHSHPWLDCFREDPENMFDPNIFREGPGPFENLESILSGRNPRGFDLLGSIFLGRPRPKIISSVEEFKKAMSDKTSELAVCLEALPIEIQEAHNKFAPIFKSGKFVVLDKNFPAQLAMRLSHLLKFSVDEEEKLQATAILEGVYIDVSSEIENGEVAELIPVIVAVSNSIKQLRIDEKRREAASKLTLRTKKFCNSLLDMHLCSLCIPEFQGPGKRNLVVEKNKEYENGKAFAPEFVLLFNGEILTDKVLGRGEGTAIWELQKEICRQNEILTKEKNQYDETIVEIAVAQDKLNKSLATIRNYCALIADANSEPVAVAVDANDAPCIIMEISIKEELLEVPSYLKRFALEKHLSDEFPLSEEQQKALGVLEQIAWIKATRAKEAEILNKL